MTAQEILSKIESLIPEDRTNSVRINQFIWKWLFLKPGQCVAMPSIPPYTSSKDALKSIRPNEWFFDIFNGENIQAFCWKKGFSPISGPRFQSPQSPFLQTEELAELHAIIQAIEYERTQTDIT